MHTLRPHCTLSNLTTHFPTSLHTLRPPCTLFELTAHAVRTAHSLKPLKPHCTLSRVTAHPPVSLDTLRKKKSNHKSAPPPIGCMVRVNVVIRNGHAYLCFIPFPEHPPIAQRRAAQTIERTGGLGLYPRQNNKVYYQDSDSKSTNLNTSFRTFKF